MTASADSTSVPATHGPVTTAIRANEREHDPSRRLLLAGLAAAPFAPRPALGVECPDAALLAWEPIVDAMAARVDDTCREASRLQTVAFGMVGASPAPHTQAYRKWATELCEAEAACGHTAAEAVFSAALASLDDAIVEIADVPATTLKGLAFKAILADRHDSETLRGAVFADLVAMGGRA